MAASAVPAAKRAKISNNKRHHVCASATPTQHLLTLSSSSSMNNQQQTDQEKSDDCERKHHGPLLPGLPDDLARQCLSNLPPFLLFGVCHKWRQFMYSLSFPSPALSVYSLLTDVSDSSNPTLSFASYDPFSASWDPLPPPPLPSPLLLKHPSFVSRLLPVQTVSSSPYLLLLSASNSALQPALHSPLIFHPSPPRWQVGPSFPLSPRRWCATGSLDGSLYIFSGVGSLYNASLARSAFKWDTSTSPCHWKWDALAPLKDGTFSREAVDALASDGKLCMVNMRGRCSKEGLIYNVRMDQWNNMPPGLLSGWIGPAVADENGHIYVVDDLTGTLRVYHWGHDKWRIVARDDRLRGATQMAAGGGKVCVVAGGGEALVVADVKGRGRRIWIVEPPCGKKLLNVHILPRMSRGQS